MSRWKLQRNKSGEAKCISILRVSVICAEIVVYDQTEKVPYEYLPFRKIAIRTAKIVIPTAKEGRQGGQSV